MSKPNEPAFPVMVPAGHYRTGPGGEGLTKREYFSGMAMQAMLSNPAVLEVVTGGQIIDGSCAESVSIVSCRWADALLAELAKEKP